MIKTWQQRCGEHQEHLGIVTNEMIQARMQEEIDDLRRVQWQTITDDEILAQTLRMSLALDVGAFKLGALWAEKELRRKNAQSKLTHT